MSFHEISIAVRAENRASYAFRAIAMDVVHLGYSFGMLDSQTGRVISGIMSAVHLFLSLKAVLTTTTVAQTAHNVAAGSGAAIQTTLAGATTGATIAHGGLVTVILTATGTQAAFNASLAVGHGFLYSAVVAIGAKIAALLGLTAATGAATGATMAFNVALAFKVGLLTLGVGVVIAAAAAMSILAMQTRAATDAMRGYSSAAGEAIGSTRGVSRAGEEEAALRRRGVTD